MSDDNPGHNKVLKAASADGVYTSSKMVTLASRYGLPTTLAAMKARALTEPRLFDGIDLGVHDSNNPSGLAMLIARFTGQAVTRS